MIAKQVVVDGFIFPKSIEALDMSNVFAGDDVKYVVGSNGFLHIQVGKDEAIFREWKRVFIRG